MPTPHTTGRKQVSKPVAKRSGGASAHAVAERAQVSVDTVWQILGGRGGRYSEQTRHRVEQAAAAVGYRRNAGAVAISTGRFGCVTMVTSTTGHRSVWDPELFAGLEHRLGRAGHHLTLACLGDEELRGDGSLAKLMRERMADGLILNYVYEIPSALEQAISRHGLGAVWVNRRLPSACAHPDDRAAGRQATAALLALGHRRIVYLSSHPTPHYSDADRAAGYAAAMRAAGLAPQLVQSQDSPDQREAWMRRLRVLLSGPDRPTAAVVYGSFAAYPLVLVARDMGLRMPGDLSLVTFGAHGADEIGVALSTWIIPVRAMGEAAADLALAAIAGQATPARAIPFTELVGATCAPPSV